MKKAGEFCDGFLFDRAADGCVNGLQVGPSRLHFNRSLRVPDVKGEVCRALRSHGDNFVIDLVQLESGFGRG